MQEQIICNKEDLVAIADAVRASNGSIETYNVPELSVAAVGAIESGTGGGSACAILYTEQTLTDEQKEQARANIEAASTEAVSQLSEKIAVNTAALNEIGTQEDIVQQVIAALGTPVFGTVDENKVITLKGDLAKGTYTYVYENKDGSITTIGTQTVEEDVEPTYTNVLPLAINADGTPYVGANGEKGYKAGYRLNSGGLETAEDGAFVTGFIPANFGDRIYLGNINFYNNPEKSNKCYVTTYDASFNKIGMWRDANFVSGYEWAFNDGSVVMDGNNMVSIVITNGVLGDTGTLDAVKYFRLSAWSMSNESIITLNEPIIKDEQGDNGSSMPTSGTVDLLWKNGIKIDKATGADGSGDGYAASQYIDLWDGYTYTAVKQMVDGSIYGGISICYYATDGSYLGYEELWAADSNPHTVAFTPLENAATFRVRGYFNTSYNTSCVSVTYEKMTYTNQIPISTDTDGSIYNGTGYKTASRANSSGEIVSVDTPSASNPTFATGFIPCKQGDVIRFKNCFMIGNSDGNSDAYGNGIWGLRSGVYNASKAKIDVFSWGQISDGSQSVVSDIVIGSQYHVTEFKIAQSDVSYIRLTLAADKDAGFTAADAVVTVNEPIE